MKKYYISLIVLLVGLLCVNPMTVRAKQKANPWKGYQRSDFKVDGCSCFLIKPEKSAVGNPWVWRARFPNYHPESDILLLQKGFHIAYIDTDDMLGSPRALEHWDDFYEFMIKDKGMSEKVALEAVSRGGLFAYRWAARNPDYVACIYAEVPVCDFKSWPLGQGHGVGAKGVWKKLLKEYGFTEEQALAYRENPIDVLESIAKANIPVMHLVSLNDRVVPPKENTFVLAERYRKLGGNIEIVEVEIGTSCKGHHFAHPDPKRVADFISKNE